MLSQLPLIVQAAYGVASPVGAQSRSSVCAYKPICFHLLDLIGQPDVAEQDITPRPKSCPFS